MTDKATLLRNRRLGTLAAGHLIQHREHGRCMVYDPRPDSPDITVMFAGNDHPTDIPKSEIIIITEMIDNEAGARYEKERREKLLADRAASALACLAAAEQQSASSPMATALKDFTPPPVAPPSKPVAPPKPAAVPEKKPFWKR